MDLFVARNSPDSNVCNNEQSSSLIAISLPYALRRSIFLFFSSFFLFREHAEYVPFDTYIINRGHSDKFMAFEKTFLVLFECKFDVEEERD